MGVAENQNLVLSSAAACGVNPTVAFYQIKRESSFNERAVGGAGERGLAQFMPGTWARFGSGSFDNAFIPHLAMNAYCGYMNYLLALFAGDYSKALTGYNGGEGHLTNPSRYGPPSAAALAYARELLAQANAGGASLPSTPAGAGALSGQTSTMLLLAVLGLGAVWALSD